MHDSQTDTSIVQAGSRAQQWLFDSALPLWADRGIDADLLFHEKLDLEGRPDLAVPRRMRVQARQLYVYYRAAEMGWRVPFDLEAAFDGFARRCYAPDGQPGWIHLLSPSGEPRDLSRDTYDQAFALFALAQIHRHAGDARSRRLADETLGFLDTQVAHPSGGYREGLPASLPRRANPHMHLLEALLAWYEATRDQAYLDRANVIIELFLSHFFDTSSGIVGEYFNEDWTRASGDAGDVVEPGHHFEWAWLLSRAAQLGGRAALAQAEQLYAFASKRGLDSRGFAVDECNRGGHQTRQSRRLWPQTELMRAHLTFEGGAAAVAPLADGFLETYLGTAIPGLWMDQFDAAGQPMVTTVPASSFYHIMTAWNELLAKAGVAQ